ncbi:MAG: non-ribosomal peptide synthetase [Woeseiaceae bacterium]|nr:non-ribosomal peptide synthetase [Woeseiaceae bacterium]
MFAELRLPTFSQGFRAQGCSAKSTCPASRLILNGAEPISVRLCEEFLTAMQAYGLRRTAMLPVYGLAEATLAVTFPRLREDYRYLTIDRHALATGEPFVPVANDSANGLKVVKLGSAIGGRAELRISDDDDVPLADGRVGHIQVRGPNVTKGLYGDDADAAGLFTADGWLRTGDCGAIADGELVITGRQKEIIIVNGQNYVPHDIEEIVSGIDGLDLGKVVVCGARKPGSRTEELLVFVLYRKDLESFASLADEIGTTVGMRIGLEVDHVIPVTRIPKTTSGKIQRNLLARAYMDGEYDEVANELRERVSAAAVDPDEDPLVRELEAICAEFSRDRVVGPDDNLFEVGISSLTLTEIMLAVDEKYPGKVDINDLFDHPTLRELAKFLRR